MKSSAKIASFWSAVLAAVIIAVALVCCLRRTRSGENVRQSINVPKGMRTELMRDSYAVFVGDDFPVQKNICFSSIDPAFVFSLSENTLGNYQASIMGLKNSYKDFLSSLNQEQASVSLSVNDKGQNIVALNLSDKKMSKTFQDLDCNGSWDIKSEATDTNSKKYIELDGIWVRATKKGKESTCYVIDNGDEYVFDWQTGLWKKQEGVPH